MTEASWIMLREVLAERYDELCRRLAVRLGSKEAARETLHETWLHLRSEGQVGEIERPFGYLLRTALNLAISRERTEQRRNKHLAMVDMLDLVDPAPGPDRETEARRQVEFLEQVLQELTPRRRAILLASRVEGVPLKRIAEHLGLSQRFVEMELKAGLEYCAQRFSKTITRRFGPRSKEASS
jgi:RNA polymerase sigma factor (sigma-70 family)